MKGLEGLEIIGELGQGYKAIYHGEYVMVDGFGDFMTERGYDRIFNYKEGLACVQAGDTFGFIDENGEEVVPCSFKKVVLDVKNAIIVYTQEGWGILDDKSLECKESGRTLDEILGSVKCGGDINVIG